MGKRGPQPLPGTILQMRGSTLAKRRTDYAVELGKPTMPAYLSASERQTWRRLVTLLTRAGLLARLDGDLLGRYCVLAGQWLRAMLFVSVHGQTYEVTDLAGNRHYKLYPEVRLLESLHKDLARIEASFGLSPSARASLHMMTRGKDDGNTTDTKARFFKRA